MNYPLGLRQVEEKEIVGNWIALVWITKWANGEYYYSRGQIVIIIRGNGKYYKATVNVIWTAIVHIIWKATANIIQRATVKGIL